MRVCSPPVTAVARLEGELKNVEALKDLKQELKQQKEVACSVVNFDGCYMDTYVN